MNAQDKANRDWTRMQPCLICHSDPAGDAHHWPVRKGHGAGYGLLEIVPMCRRDHDIAHNGDHRVLRQLARAGALYNAYLKEVLGVCDNLGSRRIHEPRGLGGSVH